MVDPPKTTNGWRLTVRSLSPKHGIEYLLGSSGVLIAIKGIISNLQGTAYGIREYQFYQDTPGEATVRIVPSGDASNFLAYLDLLNRKMAGELSVKLSVVENISTTTRGKRKFVDQRLDFAPRAERAKGGHFLRLIILKCVRIINKDVRFSCGQLGALPPCGAGPL